MKHWDQTRDSQPAETVPVGRKYRGQLAYHSGLAAENSVELTYLANGMNLLCRRWRGPGGEIDLIFADGARIVFVEVKKARTFAHAAERISPRQAGRIATSAMAFLEGRPAGSLTDMRIDVALVDQVGAVEVVENAFSGYW